MKHAFTHISDILLEQEYIRRNCIKLGEQVSSSAIAAKHLKMLFIAEHKKEHFAALFLNGQNKLIRAEIPFEGSLTSSAVYPREIVKKAIQHDAACVIVGHNHPSGNLKPSSDDLIITKKIKDGLQLIDVPLIDHIIIGFGIQNFYSFADSGVL